MRDHLDDFIAASEWPPSSPDLNPLDYGIWGILEAKVSTKSYSSVAALKAALMKAWNEISDDVLMSTCDSAMKRLRLCCSLKGGAFEI
ncbi:hypothetical protein Y032_0163g3483 [Ancylostoma ceylanicum]|nr:hypothetical protein Y032_0163g3483 [Ancylostoma ceylanicum]